MKLTEKQEQRIARHIQEIAARLANQPPQKRQEAIARERERIRAKLEQLGNSPPRDQDIEEVMKAAKALPSQPERPPTEARFAWSSLISWPDRTLLGVCAGLAKLLDVPPLAARALVVIVALAPPFFPVIVGIYLGVFLVVYFKSSGNEMPRIDWLKIVRFVSTTFGISLAFFWGIIALLWAFGYAYVQLAGHALVLDERCAWLEHNNGAAFVWALLFLVPLAVLSTLPVPAGWDGTLRKVVQAGLAVYALVLCYGIATMLVGIVLRVAKDAGGPGGFEAFTSWLSK